MLAEVMKMKKDGFLKYGLSALFCLCVICVVLVAPAAAGTESVTVTKYCDNNYSVVDDSETISWTDMRDNFTHVVSNGEIYMQGPVFEDEWIAAGLNANDYNVWDEDEEGVNLVSYGAHNGTSIEDLLVRVDNMSPGAELLVADSTYPKADRYFSYDNVYTPVSCQGDMVLTWWDSVDGFAPNWGKGMRLYFYNETENNFTNWDMHESLPSWYWKFYSTQYPSAKGLSVQTVDTIKIFPAHRYDFATGGDTVESAYEGEVGATPAVNEPSSTTVDTSKIATVNNVFETTVSANDGKFAAQRFVFDLSEDTANIEKLAFTWTGTSSHDNGSADQDATTYIWKNNVGYVALSSVTSGISDYVVNGDVTVLVKQNAAQSSDGMDDYYSHLETDYVKLVVTHHHSN
ncbi:hypothetical protein [Methanogenium sp. MK-MG]|uniref:hypothetical protein n=1 Tax=Methanogenium sp. MK-MG TaxID=2599926 RepID=UPI0013E9D6C4|nr:hypothetical protein [Methanogenium sp. MK-MG]KAF1078715.1 hypothetical protein MKMG_00370 [Methanogenium sp. MK-MG]